MTFTKFGQRAVPKFRNETRNFNSQSPLKCRSVSQNPALLIQGYLHCVGLTSCEIVWENLAWILHNMRLFCKERDEKQKYPVPFRPLRVWTTHRKGTSKLFSKSWKLIAINVNGSFKNREVNGIAIKNFWFLLGFAVRTSQLRHLEISVVLKTALSRRAFSMEKTELKNIKNPPRYWQYKIVHLTLPVFKHIYKETHWKSIQKQTCRIRCLEACVAFDWESLFSSGFFCSNYQLIFLVFRSPKWFQNTISSF